MIARGRTARGDIRDLLSLQVLRATLTMTTTTARRTLLPGALPASRVSRGSVRRPWLRVSYQGRTRVPEGVPSLEVTVSGGVGQINLKVL
jgi:hypothetical protein